MGNELDPRVLQIVLEKLPEYGLKLVSQPSATSLHVSSPSHKSAMINLENVAEHYAETGDEEVLEDFVSQVAAALNPEGSGNMEPDSWEEARGHIYYAMRPYDVETLPEIYDNVTEYSIRYLILETPKRNIWVTPEMLEKWDVTEEEARQVAAENGDRLLAETELVVQEGSQGAIGYFDLEDETLNAALLFAPSFGERVGERFGWPLYAVMPTSWRFCVFSTEDYETLEDNIRDFVENFYDDSRCVTPELLQVGPGGIRAVEVLIDVYGDDEDDEDE